MKLFSLTVSTVLLSACASVPTASPAAPSCSALASCKEFTANAFSGDGSHLTGVLTSIPDPLSVSEVIALPYSGTGLGTDLGLSGRDDAYGYQTSRLAIQGGRGLSGYAGGAIVGRGGECSGCNSPAELIVHGGKNGTSSHANSIELNGGSQYPSGGGLQGSQLIVAGANHDGDEGGVFVNIPTPATGKAPGLFEVHGGGGVLFDSIPVFADNAAALSGGLSVGQLYRTGGDPDILAIVH